MQTVALALGQIWVNKTRALLTALGIIIGVGSVTAVIAGMTGLKQFVLNEFETFGANKLYLAGRIPDSMRNKVSWSQVALKVPDLEAIAEYCPHVRKVRLDIGIRTAFNMVKCSKKTSG